MTKKNTAREWTEKEMANDVCHTGNAYVQMETYDREALLSGVWYRATKREDAYNEKHSVVGIFNDAEKANAAGQALISYGLATNNSRDLKRDKKRGLEIYELTLPAVFGACWLLSHNRINVHASKRIALEQAQQRFG